METLGFGTFWCLRLGQLNLRSGRSSSDRPAGFRALDGVSVVFLLELLHCACAFYKFKIPEKPWAI